MQHGHKVERPPLPKTNDPNCETIRFDPVPDHLRPIQPSEQTKERIETEKAEENRIVVAGELETPHPLVLRTMRSLTSAVPDVAGIVTPKAKGCLQVAIGKDSIDRAMRIMNTLVTALIGRGMKVTAEEEHKWATRIHVDGEVIAMRLSESIGEHPHELTPAQRRENAQHTYFKPHPETEKYPRGLLTLTARGEADEYIQKRWSELEGKRLEDRLNANVAWLFRAAEQIRNRRIEFAERDRRWAEERRLREEAERQRLENERRLRELEEEAAAWRRARNIREYADAVEKRTLDRCKRIEPGSELDEWLKWARSRADQIDRLT